MLERLLVAKAAVAVSLRYDRTSRKYSGIMLCKCEVETYETLPDFITSARRELMLSADFDFFFGAIMVGFVLLAE